MVIFIPMFIFCFGVGVLYYSVMCVNYIVSGKRLYSDGYGIIGWLTQSTTMLWDKTDPRHNEDSAVDGMRIVVIICVFVWMIFCT